MVACTDARRREIKKVLEMKRNILELSCGSASGKEALWGVSRGRSGGGRA